MPLAVKKKKPSLLPRPLLPPLPRLTLPKMLLLPPALLVLLLPLLVPQPPLQLPRPLPLRPQPVLLPLPLKLAKMPLVLPKTLPVPPLQPLLALLVMLPRRPLTPPPALSRSKLTQIEVTHLSRKSHLRVAFFLPENVCAVHGTNPVGCKSRYQAYVEPKVSQRASASSRGGVRRKFKAKSRDDEQKPDMRLSPYTNSPEDCLWLAKKRCLWHRGGLQG